MPVVDGVAKPLAPRLRCRERGLRPRRDHLPFGLSDDSHDADNHLIRLRHVGRDEPHPSLLEAEEKVSVTAEAVQLRDNQNGIVETA
jgi:hypothetical protein